MSVKDLILLDHYENKLDIIHTEIAIKQLKDLFEQQLAKHLNLMRISAPLFVNKASGLNDNLSGSERPVEFNLKDIDQEAYQIVHSLAKWKRVALNRYGIQTNQGIYTDMNAIRRDEILDNLHSCYVDQWDWEKIIDKRDRNIECLKKNVESIMCVIKNCENAICQNFPILMPCIDEKVFFITSQKLLELYPNLSAKQREYAIVKQYKTVFIMQIGDVLSNGEVHDDRAPDYDDWSLNGDLLLYYPLLDQAIEISSMGIRVDASALLCQLKKADCESRSELAFHRKLLENKLPCTIGGGIGQSRIALMILNKAHIGEVQVSQWGRAIREECEKFHISLL